MRTRSNAAWAAVVALLVMSLDLTSLVARTQHAGAQAARPKPLTVSDAWDTFVAEIRIRRSRVDAEGKVQGMEAPPIEYRWERSATANGWKTIVTVLSRPPVVQSLTGTRAYIDPFAVARIEDDEGEEWPRFYNARGERLRLPLTEGAEFPLQAPAADDSATREAPAQPKEPAKRPQARGTGRAWVDSFITTSSGRAARRAAIERQHGTAVGRVGGLDRFLSARGADTEETLVDPVSAVPVEVNVVRGDRLLSHTVFSYAPGPSGSVVRRAIHTERLVSEDTGDRAVLDIEFANVRVERRR
jgi:hypothetical protein